MLCIEKRVGPLDNYSSQSSHIVHQIRNWKWVCISSFCVFFSAAGCIAILWAKGNGFLSVPCGQVLPAEGLPNPTKRDSLINGYSNHQYPYGCTMMHSYRSLTPRDLLEQEISGENLQDDSMFSRTWTNTLTFRKKTQVTSSIQMKTLNC